ncbi:MAG TPA: M48 family metallopeptidase [Candidatus Nanopelagicaceae bacterium]|nr:M48 family metallopeptidase [Candidatus Nanopelagicaceae bacterium]
MSNRSWLILSISVLALVLAVLVGLFTPWHVLSVPIHPLPASSDFAQAEISKAKAFHSALIPWGVGSWALGFVLAGLVGFTNLGAKFINLLPGSFFLRAFVGVIAIELAFNLVALPLDIKREEVFRTYGLSTQNWRGWFSDRLQHFALNAPLMALALASLVICARLFGSRWWIVGGAATALLVIALSFGYPVLVEPLFNKFTPMAPSPLRQELITMAARDGVPVRQILVADASRRTTALNAYVSGFGASRRIVLYDVLLANASPEEVKLVVAHELGHAKANDVGRFTLIGALSAAIGVLAIGLLVQWKPLLDRAGLPASLNPLADPRSVALVLALITVLTLVQQPVSALLSRNIEARADVHALNLTQDPEAFVNMQRSLAISNLSDPSPSRFAFWFFDNHPTPPQRIAIARSFAKLNHLQVPPTLRNGPSDNG